MPTETHNISMNFSRGMRPHILPLGSIYTFTFLGGSWMFVRYTHRDGFGQRVDISAEGTRTIDATTAQSDLELYGHGKIRVTRTY